MMYATLMNYFVVNVLYGLKIKNLPWIIDCGGVCCRHSNMIQSKRATRRVVTADVEPS